MAQILKFFLPLILVTLAYGETEEYKIGVLAKRGSDIAMKRWEPTARYLEQKIPGTRFHIVPLNFRQIETSVGDKSIDFVIANSAYYITLEMQYEVQRIATLKNRYDCEKCSALFGGVVFTRADRDDINSFETLRGKRFAAVDPQSFGGWHVAYRELKETGINPYRDFASFSFSGTHDAVVYDVLNGRVDAGTVRTETIEKMAAEGKIDPTLLKTIHPQGEHDRIRRLSTRLYPEWPFAKLPHIRNLVAEKVAMALIAMPSDSKAALTAKVNGWTIPHNYQHVHDCLKAIRVGPYKDYGKITLRDVLVNYWYLILLALLVTMGAVIIALYILRLNRNLNTQQAKITELNKELKVDIRTQKELLSSVTNSVDDLIFYKSLDFIYIGCNRAFAAYVGKPSDAIIGKSDYDLFDKETADLFRQMDIKMLERGTTRANNEWITYPDGRKAFMHTIKSPLINEKGEQIGLVGLSRDITETKRMTDELEAYKNSLEERVKEEVTKRREQEDILVQQSKLVAMGEMIQNIAHQWRQPLNSIGLLIQDIKDAYEFKELDQAYIDKVTKTALRIINQMSGTIDDFRNFFRQDKEQKEFLLKKVVDNALLIAGAALKNNDISVEVKELGDAKAMGYPNEYAQMLLNLINNAKDALKKSDRKDKKITIEIGEKGMDRAILKIADNGGGVDEAIMDKIFEPYFTTKHESEGTGIGLYMSRVIVETNMHGKISVANRNGGAVFTVEL